MISEPRVGAATTDVKGGSGRSLPGALFQAMRPRQWVKNGVLLAGIVFTLNQGHAAADWLRVLAGIAVFCFLASAIYLFNDIHDVEQDRTHPKKRLRPIAAGEVPIPLARGAAGVLAALGIGGAIGLGWQFSLVAAAYLALTLAYSLWLKHEVILDVMILASFYVLRAVAGAVVISVEISPWLLVCTTLGALFIGLAKRRNELLTLENARSHRRILEEYTVQMLDQMINIVAASTLIAYMLYTFPSFSRTAQQRPLLMLTIPFVVYGIFRFLYQIHRNDKGGDPTTDLLEDRALILCGILWGITAALIMVFGG